MLRLSHRLSSISTAELSLCSSAWSPTSTCSPCPFPRNALSLAWLFPPVIPRYQCLYPNTLLSWTLREMHMTAANPRWPCEGPPRAFAFAPAWAGEIRLGRPCCAFRWIFRNCTKFNLKIQPPCTIFFIVYDALKPTKGARPDDTDWIFWR